MTRLEICNTLGAANCILVGAEWVTDQRLEDAYYKWLQEGSPSGVIVAVEIGANGREAVRIEVPTLEEW